MKKLLMILPLVILLCFTFSCQQGEEVAEEPVVDVEADVATIKAFFAPYSPAINSGDLDGWISLFTDDAIFMPPDSVILKGKEAGREFARPFYEQLDMEISISIDEIKVFGNWAFARWSYKFQYTPKSGGETTQQNGKEIWILKRQTDSSWKCTHCIWNYNDPLPPSQKEE